MALKYYAVREGLQKGIFTSWEECRACVSGYPGAVYKSFTDREQAQAFLEGRNTEEPEMEELNAGKPDASGFTPIYVDGSYNEATGEFSYGMIVLKDDHIWKFSERFADAGLASMRNVAGEIKGAEAAMRFALQNGISKLTIYHDYEGIAKWCLGEWKTGRDGTKAYKAYYDEVSRQIEIRFIKVTGHSGDTYNELADQAAKEALGL